MPLNYPETEADQTHFDAKVAKIIEVMDIQTAGNSTIKMHCDDLKDAYGSDPAKVKKLAKLVRDQSAASLLEETEEMVSVFNQVTNKED